MTRHKNDSIGKTGERRIKTALQELGATDVQIHKDHDGHPDCSFIYLGKGYAAECKSMVPYYDKQVSSIHLRQTEVRAMRKSIIEGYIPFMIVELRPPNSKELYFAVQWDLVLQEYNMTRPIIKSLSLYWILEHGRKLADAIELIERGVI